MKFLDINLTRQKTPSHLLHAIHSPFSWRIIKTPYSAFISGLKNPYKKIRETRKVESIQELDFVERKSEGRKTRQKLKS